MLIDEVGGRARLSSTPRKQRSEVSRDLPDDGVLVLVPHQRAVGFAGGASTAPRVKRRPPPLRRAHHMFKRRRAEPPAMDEKFQADRTIAAACTRLRFSPEAGQAAPAAENGAALERCVRIA